MRLGDKIYKLVFLANKMEANLYKQYFTVEGTSKKGIRLSNGVMLNQKSLHLDKQTVTVDKTSSIIIECYSTEELLNSKIENMKYEALRLLAVHKSDVEKLAENIKHWDESRD